MSNTTTDLVVNLRIATIWINRILPVLQITFGTFGNILNIIIFTRRSLRTHPCSMYFLISSINNIFVLYVALFTRYLSLNWNINPSATNNFLCKLRIIFVYSSLCLTLWLTVLASIDRYLSSSENIRLRQWSSLPVARKLIGFTVLFTYLIHSHVLIFYKSNLNNDVRMCTIFSTEYFIFFNLFLLIQACFLPIILISILGLLIIINIRKIHNRIALHVNHIRQERIRSNDRQLITMLLFQISITILITVPYSLLSIYYLIIITILKTQPEQARFHFTSNFFLLLYYTNSVTGFYIYTLIGRKFRLEIKRCLRYGLIVTSLIQYLPFRMQQTLIREDRININHPLIALQRRRNAIYPIGS